MTFTVASRTSNVWHALTLVALLCGATVPSGCAARRPETVLVHDSARGSVYLDTVPGGTLHATQPATLDSAALARVLSGIRVEKDRIFEDIGIERGQNPPFSEEEVKYLSPLLVDAVGRAKADQVVAFRVVQMTGDGPKATGGVLWVDDPRIHVTLTEYKADAARRPAVIRRVIGAQDSTGLKQQTVTFVPEGAAQTEDRRDIPIIASPHFTTLVVDYDRLAKLLATDTARVRPAAPATAIRRPRPAPRAVEEAAPPPAAPAPKERAATPPPAPKASVRESGPPPATAPRPVAPSVGAGEPRPASQPAEVRAPAPAKAETPEETIRRQDREIQELKARMRSLERRLEERP